MNAAIRLLTSAAREQIAQHFNRLPAEERSLRFGAALDDAPIRYYVAGIDFARDRLFGVFEEGESLAGVAHLRLQGRGGSAWLVVSVSPASRCRGYGYALLRAAAMEARRLACGRLALSGLAENRILLHLARKAGLSVINELGEVGAVCDSRPQPIASLRP